MNEVEKRGHEYISNKDTEMYIVKISNWLKSPKRKTGLFLNGECGNGKTTMANALGSLIRIIQDRSVEDPRKRNYLLSESATDIADYARQELKEKLRGIRSTPILHIDDMGVEPSAMKVWGNEVSPITDILYYRYDNMLFTLVTSNLNDEDIFDRYGHRIGDRFYEMFDVLQFENQSYRQQL